MKNILFIFCIFFGSFCLADETISIVKIGPGMADNYEDAISLSSETDCNIFIYFGADWCKYCVLMKKDTFENKEVKKYLLKNYIVLNLNADKNKELKEKFNIRSLPGYIIINKNEKVVKKSSGYKSSEEFLNWIKD